MHRFEFDLPFCSNPDCELHVRAGMPGIVGGGNWAILPGGRVVGRATYCGVFLCDACLHEWTVVAAFLGDGTALRWTARGP
jgi:hypothetical protein